MAPLSFRHFFQRPGRLLKDFLYQDFGMFRIASVIRPSKNNAKTLSSETFSTFPKLAQKSATHEKLFCCSREKPFDKKEQKVTRRFT